MIWPDDMDNDAPGCRDPATMPIVEDDWFWAALESAKPRLAALEAWLTAQPTETVEAFERVYRDLAGDLADFWDGIVLDGFAWSEDDLEDLCTWVVGQGREFWTRVESGEWALAVVAEAYLGRASPLAGSTVRWDPTVTDPAHHGYESPALIASGVLAGRTHSSPRPAAPTAALPRRTHSGPRARPHAQQPARPAARTAARATPHAQHPRPHRTTAQAAPTPHPRRPSRGRAPWWLFGGVSGGAQCPGRFLARRGMVVVAPGWGRGRRLGQ